jgi:hypothetical protein
MCIVALLPWIRGNDAQVIDSFPNFVNGELKYSNYSVSIVNCCGLSKSSPVLGEPDALLAAR